MNQEERTTPMTTPTNVSERAKEIAEAEIKANEARRGFSKFLVASELGHHVQQALDAHNSAADRAILELRKQLATAIRERDEAREQLFRAGGEPLAVLGAASENEKQIRAQVSDLTAEVERLKGVIAGPLSGLIGYAGTIRTDRPDATKEFALQTVDWCEGLLEQAVAAKEATSNAQSTGASDAASPVPSATAAEIQPLTEAEFAAIDAELDKAWERAAHPTDTAKTEPGEWRFVVNIKANDGDSSSDVGDIKTGDRVLIANNLYRKDADEILKVRRESSTQAARIAELEVQLSQVRDQLDNARRGANAELSQLKDKLRAVWDKLQVRTSELADSILAIIGKERP